VSLINRFISINAPRSRELSQFIDFINGKNPFLNPGNRHFWKSDIMVQHGSDFYLSARVPSKRTMGSETMNDENLKKKWLPWGATNIMIDGDEYRNIYPTWDWSRIPGVTGVLEDIPGGMPFTGGAYIVSATDFAGGVSDGTYGLAAYDYSWDGVSGRKAWFFTPEAMYCFGSGIKASKEKQVITSVNQCFSSGKVAVMNNKKLSSVEGTEVTSPGIKWIYHDRVGYLFPAGGEITVKNADQTGTWYDINLSQSKTPVINKVFSTWIDHGKNPSDARYEYIVVPFKDLSQFTKWQKKNPLKMVSNSPDIQAVFDNNGNIYGIAFYKSGTVSLGEGLNVETDKPCLILIQVVSKSGYKISVSDPTALLTDLNIKISDVVHGRESTNNPDGTTSINFVLPSGDEAGKSVTSEFSRKIITAI
jgi:chondroitin AC lyase